MWRRSGGKWWAPLPEPPKEGGRPIHPCRRHVEPGFSAKGAAMHQPGWLVLRPNGTAQCEHTYMESTGESPSPPKTSRGEQPKVTASPRGGVESNRRRIRGPEQKVNPIRPVTAASLLRNGEACRKGGDRCAPHPSSMGKHRAVGGDWGGNAGKVSCGSVEICPGRIPRERDRAEVRAAIVAWKRGNARGAKGGRKVERRGP